MRAIICKCSEGDMEDFGEFGQGSLFQRRHYIAIAKVIAELPETTTRNEIVNKFAELFASDNPLFDPERFRNFIEARVA